MNSETGSSKINKGTNPGHLLKVYTIFSILSLLVILFLINFSIRKIYLQQNINEAEHDAIGISKMIMERERSMILTDDPTGEGTVNIAAEDFEELDTFMFSHLQPLNIIKIKIFSKDGKIVYSTDHSIIGQIDDHNKNLEKALKGEIVSKLEIKDTAWDLDNEQRFNVDLVETYLPVRNKENEIVGSFELYRDISLHQKETKKVLHLSMFLITVLLFLSYGLLFILMRRGVKKLREHTDSLSELNIEFEKEIGERKHAEERMNHMAFYDNLTGLPNRYLFQDRLNMSIANAKRTQNKLAVLFIDIDDFKRINDMLGHGAGDHLLKGVADKINNCIRATDSASHNDEYDVNNSSVARLGGDEFTVLLTNIQDSQDIVKVARRLMKSVSRPFQLNGKEVYVTFSIGIAMCPDDGNSVESLLKDADTALYHAKGQGKNNFKFYKGFMNELARKNLIMENDLRHAVKGNEMMVYYQPRIDVRTGAIVSMEALARWNKPGEGIISPDEFIPVAEDSGLIVDIGAWVLETACGQNKTWQMSGTPPLTISVNMSVKQFQHEKFLATISNALKNTSLDPRYLELEITENILLQDAEKTIKMLNELKDMGIRLAMDDFGTGYSSFNYLIRFPLDIIKIDMSFIRNITEKAEHAAVVEAIISMSHSLNLRVVAEGVETQQQLDLLREFGCDEIQGYYYSHPLPGGEFTEYLEKSMHKSLAAENIKNGS